MKKLLILVAALLLVGSAFAQSGGRLFVQPNASNIGTGQPSTTNNNDSCDIGVAPAATLLLPYFEVNFNSDSTSAVNTIFSITNTSSVPQIAKVTVWTDWSYPVLDFNVYLTGYDVQAINLYDILANGSIPQTEIDSDTLSPQGVFSNANTDNPNFTTADVDCANPQGGQIPNTANYPLLTMVQQALTGGEYFTCSQVGGTHANAVGYITIDTVATCTSTLPNDVTYYQDELLYNNVLIGDYQRVNSDVTTGNYAGGNPLVSIRAIPGGGPVNSDNAGPTATNLPMTFYQRYTETIDDPLYAHEDRRQPLPSVWAARYVENGGSTQDIATNYAIWREGPRNASCDTASDNGSFGVTEIVRFDEHENPYAASLTTCVVSPCQELPDFGPQFAETGSYSTTDTDYFPPDITATTDLGGWMYLNLGYDFSSIDNELKGDYRFDSTESSWVVVQMTAEGRYGADFNAAWLGAGCSPNPGAWTVVGSSTTTCDGWFYKYCGIGPLPDETPLP